MEATSGPMVFRVLQSDLKLDSAGPRPLPRVEFLLIFHINSNQQCLFGMGLSHVATHAQEVCWGEVCQGEASGTGAAGLVSGGLL